MATWSFLFGGEGGGHSLSATLEGLYVLRLQVLLIAWIEEGGLHNVGKLLRGEHEA